MGSRLVDSAWFAARRVLSSAVRRPDQRARPPAPGSPPPERGGPSSLRARGQTPTGRGRRRNATAFAFILSGLVLLGAGAGATPAPARAAAVPTVTPRSSEVPARADAAFTELWDRTDLPVAQGLVVRPWLWGPTPLATRYEAHDESPGGQHLVRYYDRGRMDIDGPLNDPATPPAVGGGLLVVELVTGRVQVGDRVSIAAPLAEIAVTDAPALGGDMPTYAVLSRVGSFAGHRRAPDRTGQPVVERLQADGAIRQLAAPPEVRRIATYEPTIGHNLPDVFWEFLNATGPIYEQGQLVTGPLMNWLALLGYPLTEPYWVQVREQGQDRAVLIQAFQRRVLTYTPGNPPGLQIELSNTGRAYLQWRDAPPPLPADLPGTNPPPALWVLLVAVGALAAALLGAVLLRHPVLHATLHNAPPAPATLSITGTDFPPGVAVTVLVEAPAGAPRLPALTTATGDTGGWAVQLALPEGGPPAGPLTVEASALAGAVTARTTLPRRGGSA